MKIRNGTIRLGMGHSLIIGHGPRLSTLEAVKAEEVKRKVESFGLFNIVTPDTSTYYKDVTAEDLSPKPEDFVKPIFRGLSEVIVRKSFDPIDFAHEKGVLKASMPLLLGQSIYTNHEAAVGNEVGVVSQTFWQDAYKDGSFSIPAGINFEAMVDGKNHPKLARNLLSEPPTVHSNSVTVQFKWAQSHPQMSYDEFRNKVGTFDAKKELIRRIVTNIDAYHETSFVSHGADPYAQIMDKEGKIINPKYASNRDSFSEEKKVTNYYFSDCKQSFSEVTIPEETNISELEVETQEPETIKMKKELILLFAQIAGLSISAEDQALPEAEFTEKFGTDEFQTQLLAKKVDLEAITNLQIDLTAEQAKVIDLESKLEIAEKFKTDNSAALADLSVIDTFKAAELAELLRVHALVTGAEPSAELKATYEKANLQTLQAFLTPLNTQLEAKFPMKCNACESTDVNRASASAENPDPNKNKGPKDNLHTRQSLQDKHRKKFNNGFLGEGAVK